MTEKLKKDLLYYFLAECNWKFERLYDPELAYKIKDQKTLDELKEWVNEGYD